MRKILTAAFAAVLPLMAATTGAQAQIKLKISAATVNDITQEWGRVFAAGVESRAGGKIKVEYYPANQLGAIPATVEGTALGTIEMVSVIASFFVGLEPRFLIFDAPGLFVDFDRNARLFADPQVRARLGSFGKAKGVEPIAFLTVNPLYLLSHKPVRTVADIAGLKIRTPGGAPLHLEPLRRLGASPLSMPLGEVLPAMQNRTIDGLIAGVNVYVGFKYFDIAKTITSLPAAGISPVLANSAFLKSLGPDLEKIVREEAEKAEVATLPWAKKDFENGLATWEKNGGVIVKLGADDEKKYLDTVNAVLPQVAAATPGFKDDHDAISAAIARLQK